MNAWAATTPRGGRELWALASRVLLLVALAALLYLVGKITLALVHGEFASVVRLDAPLTLALAGAVYLSGHGLRILRLALLIGGWRVGLRVIASFHLMTAAVSLTAPLKLGELYRVLELGNLAGGLIRAVIITWWERAFDVAMILIILAVALTGASREAGAEFFGVTALAAAFIIATAAVFFVAPDNLRRLSVLIIRRYDSPRTVPVLRLSDLVRRAIQEAPTMVRGKVASVATLTVLIWSCEIACVALVLPLLGGSAPAALDALLGFLSAVTRGETLLGALSDAPGMRMLPYLAATQAPLAVLGLMAGVHYAWMRLSARRENAVR